MRTRVLGKLISIFLCLLQIIPVSAEFIKTGHLVYQSSDKRSRVIVSQDMPGLFIVSGPEIDLQEFNPINLRLRDSLAMFVHVDSQRKTYQSINIGKRTYQLKSFVSLNLGTLKITVDNSNPYISIIDGQNTKTPSVLAFSGLNEVINATGEGAVALLEANQLNKYKELIKPFTVTQSGLQLENQFYAEANIGLDMEIQNPCLEATAVYVDAKQFELADKATTAEEQRNILKNALKQGRPKEAMKSAIRLSVDRGAIVLLDYNLFQLFIVKKRADLSSAKLTVCEVRPYV